ncbi:ATP-binding protein [Aestuariibacter salexigens]|uniref:hybrid sensor histidine kinase/response regulator n=1 Tax=Aestuariibacter salexigens TaxID=226010 RepID=UPI00041FD911|nr:ATP-binding protein [Aestuariibacter salexigens]
MSEHLDHFLERVPFGLAIVHKNGTIDRINTHLSAMLGYEPHELKGQQIETLLPEASRNKHIKLRQSYYKDPTMIAMGRGRVLSARCKDGSLLQVEVLLDYQQDEYVLVTVIDVSEREMSLEALRETQKINKTGTWRFDLVKNEVWWSPELFRIFDLPVSDLAPPYDTHRALFTEESWQRLEPAVARAAEKGIPYELELTLKAENGANRVAVARCQPRKNKDGKVFQLVGTFQDITELAATQVERDQLFERLTMAQNAAGIGVWEWLFNENAFLWDDHMHRIYGLSKGNITYNDWAACVHPSDIKRVERQLNKAIQNQQGFKSHFRIIKDNATHYVLTFASISDNRLLGVAMDVTEPTRLREEARKLNNLESLGALAGGIAHDFNNQLASISARAELLLHKEFDAKFVKKIGKELTQAVERASGLTKQLLTFAKGGSPLRESASIEELVIQTVEFSLHGANLTVNYDFEKNLHNVEIDPLQIGQVIQNIVINAIQAIKADSGQLTITARNITGYSDDAPDQLQEFVDLVIADNGPGIPEDALSKIFDPYFTTKEDGHGLGLSICHSIIKQHQGDIHVHSQLGKGCQFTIRLPATDKQQPNEKDTKPVSQHTGKILVVDDMVDVLESTQAMLEALGYECTIAETVDEALRLFEQQHIPDDPVLCVITDLTMPGSGGGLEVLKRVKQLDPTVKVIVTSGYTGKLQEQTDQALTFDGSLPKPCTLSSMQAEIERVTG